MAIKSTDGKVEMVLSVPNDKVFLGGIKTITKVMSEVGTAEISLTKAEIDTVFGEAVKVLSLKNGETIQVSDMTKGE